MEEAKLDPRPLAERALSTWGQHAQVEMVQEEMAELLVTLSQWKRGRLNIDNVAEEVADVEIVLHTLRILVGDKLVDAWKAAKLDRLQDRLDKVERERMDNELRKLGEG